MSTMQQGIRDLKRHMMKLEPESNKPFQCDICDKGFVRKDHFVNHKKSHQRKKTKKNVIMKHVKLENEL